MCHILLISCSGHTPSAFFSVVARGDFVEGGGCGDGCGDGCGPGDQTQETAQYRCMLFCISDMQCGLYLVNTCE